MAQVTDAKHAALIAQGFSGATNDMLLQWLQFQLSPPNLHLNSTYQGGAASGPGPGEFPPTAFTIGFNTADSGPLGIDQWDTNTGEVSARSYLNYSLFDNHPSLQAGPTYRYGLVMENKSGNNYGAALNTAGLTNVTIIDSQTTVQSNSTAFCFIDFVITDVVYSMSIRSGNGTSSNNVANIVLSPARLAELSTVPVLNSLPDAWKAMLDVIQPPDPDHRSDQWYEWLLLNGYGAPNQQRSDMEKDFWVSGGLLIPKGDSFDTGFDMGFGA